MTGMKAACQYTVLLVLLTAGNVSAEPFTDVTEAVGLSGINGTAAAWGDYDGDGWVDVYVNHRLFRNDHGKFTQVKGHGEWGRVELTTMTKEFFMPRFLERDEAIRRAPRAPYAWDGVAEVRPFGAMEKKIVEGVY